MSDLPPNSPLASFLYLLMRDHLPTGVVAELANRVVHSDEEPIAFTAPELGSLAFRYANRIQPVPEEEAEEHAEAWLAQAPMRVLEELSREKLGVGNALDIVEVAAAVGWDISKEEDMAECSRIVQQHHDDGYVQRNRGEHPVKILITDDGEARLAELRA